MEGDICLSYPTSCFQEEDELDGAQKRSRVDLSPFCLPFGLLFCLVSGWGLHDITTELENKSLNWPRVLITKSYPQVVKSAQDAIQDGKGVQI